MSRTFRILILDDRTASTAKTAIAAGQSYDWSSAKCKAIGELLAKNKNGEPKVEVFLSSKAQMVSVWSVVTKQEQKLDEPEEVKAFLRTLDVIILDIRGIGSTRQTKNFETAVRENFARIGKSPPQVKIGSTDQHHGIEFFHVYFQDFNTNCLVAILTAFDGEKDSVIDAYLHDFTIETTGLPYVVKFGKNSKADNWLTDLILGHYDFFGSGLSDATNRFQISFAARHDHPVMIVGESGTGKEGIAKFIHKQWKRRKVKENLDLQKKVGRYQVVNCGGLSEQMAQAELFGYLRGTFTGADEHRLGKVFLAAGIDPLGKAPKSKAGVSYEQAERDLSDLRDGFAALDSAPQGKKNETFLREVQPHLNNLFRPDKTLR
jgi:hypothetical protein